MNAPAGDAMLTVVMPVYNLERYVAEAIESVLAQTYRDFRLLIADDGSADRTLEIARAYEARDPRVKVISHPNLGTAANMNDALAHVETEWVACMHGDDVMLPKRLERQVAFITENPDLALVSSLIDWIDDGGRVVGRSRSPFITRESISTALRTNVTIAFPHPAVMFKRSVVDEVGGYRQAFFPAEDLDLWNRIAERGHGVLVQPEVLLHYRIHAASATMTKLKHIVEKLRWVERCVRDRRAGLPEPTWEQHIEACEAAGLWARLTRRRRDLGYALYQTAVTEYAFRHYWRAAPIMVAAVSLQPGLVLPRLLSRVTSLFGANRGPTTPAPRPPAAAAPA